MKSKVHMEYLFGEISSTRLWGMVGTPAGLSKWFCDACEVNEEAYVFVWQKSRQLAQCLKVKEKHVIRFRWEGEQSPEAYFEFRIVSNELTDDVSLEIVDYVTPGEEEECQEWWDSQVEKLRRALGT